MPSVNDTFPLLEITPVSLAVVLLFSGKPNSRQQLVPKIELDKNHYEKHVCGSFHDLLADWLVLRSKIDQKLVEKLNTDEDKITNTLGDKDKRIS